ncbi:LolA-like outer membrane lipoprotein chaperone [Sulfurimonas sp.]|uniref:LolA-like outer membrane lipoprotein chaperone n=1 Tax=Sulfurimonas sp. TaxID=2022749 RepID=UPI0025D7C74B|nr:LolA-like outer membrane lipoprotein chaperone [Sulfurimonas sp.]
MKHLFTLLLSSTLAFASFDSLTSFQADFTQSVTDDKDKSLVYKGHVAASKPQNALWNYTKPINKDVFINKYSVTIVEPEIEQVIIRKINSNLDFFNMIENAKKIEKNVFEAHYKESKFTITTKNKIIETISYVDEFENKVKIVFKNQEQNQKINMELFIPNYPLEFDVIRD